MRTSTFLTHLSAFAASLLLAGCAGLKGGTGGGTQTIAPTISSQPASQSVTVGQTATFTVMATGTAPLTYQWLKNNSNIGAATSASYTTPATVAGDNGASFTVVVSNSAGNVTSSAATLTVNTAPVGPSITTQPANQTVTVGQTATFSVVATGTAPLSYQWQKNSANINGATSASYTTPATTSADNNAKFDVIVTNSVNNVTSSQATLTVNAATGSSINVVTYHYDNLRTGQNLNETTLTTANVNSTKFGKLGTFSVDGLVDAQPLYLSSVPISGGAKNVLYVVTEHGSVYAFNADSVGSAPLWKVSLIPTANGETTSDDRGCSQVTPEIGITSTPVIDLTRGPHGAIYVVAMSKNGGTYFQRLHALDVTTGAELFGGPTTIQATFPGTGANSSGGNVIFDPAQYKERAGLLEINGTIYTTWASHCDIDPYTSWVMSFSASTLAPVSVLDLVPNGNEGGIWMASTAPAADASGNIYFMVGNGDFGTALTNGFPTNGNCGQCYVKISPAAPMKLLDYFTPLNTVSESNGDVDLGSGGPLLLPDLQDASHNTRHLAVGSGKDAIIYVVDRDNMGKFSSSQNNIYQEIDGQLGGGVFAKPSYFNGTVYYGAVGDNLKAFPISNAKLATNPSSQSTASFGYPGTTPSISANGTSNGIVWAIQNSSGGVLHAYDASNLTNELYNSNQAASNRDHFADNKYITPMVANGKVYVGTPNSVVVFGLLP